MFTSRRIAVLLLLILPLISALAEDLNRGRLPDGRAFRVDAEGNQIVDYIAELEVTVQSLNRQVRGLEDELDEKHGRLMRLEEGRGAPAAVREIDLVNRDNDAESQSESVAIAPRFPDEAMPARSAAKSCQDELEILRSEFNNSGGSCGSLREAYDKELAWYKTVVKGYKNELQKLSGKPVDESALAAPEVKIDPQALEQANAKIAELEEQLNQSSKELELVKTREADAQAKLRNAASESSKPQTNDHLNRASARLVTDPASASRSREKVMTTIKGSIRTELNQLNSMISMRDDLYRKYAKSSSGLSLQPRKTVSSRHLTPSQIGALAQSATYPAELNNLKRDIAQIQGIVKDDIATVKRLQQAG